MPLALSKAVGRQFFIGSDVMSPTIHLIRRVRSEFTEMPGLRLRVDQAQRLWNLDRSSCEMLLSSLVEAKFLRRYSDEAYGLPSAH
jgi:hypothetical protein